jgi:hypothetical protein
MRLSPISRRETGLSLLTFPYGHQKASIRTSPIFHIQSEDVDLILLIDALEPNHFKVDIDGKCFFEATIL